MVNSLKFSREDGCRVSMTKVLNSIVDGVCASNSVLLPHFDLSVKQNNRLRYELTISLNSARMWEGGVDDLSDLIRRRSSCAWVVAIGECPGYIGGPGIVHICLCSTYGATRCAWEKRNDVVFPQSML